MDLAILPKTAMSPIFRNFWRNCRNRSFCWSPFYLLCHLNLVILTKTTIAPIFRNFCYRLQTWTCMSHTFLCFVSKIGFAMFWIRISLISVDLVQIGISLALWVSVSIGSYLKREIPAWNLASGMQNALRPTPATVTTVNPSSVLLFLTVTSFQHQLP